MKPGIRTRAYLLFIVTAAMAFGCGSSEPQNGAVLCGKAPHSCPEGYLCSGTGIGACGTVSSAACGQGNGYGSQYCYVPGSGCSHGSTGGLAGYQQCN